MTSPRLLQIVQALSIAGVAWFAFGLLYRLHVILVVLLVLVVAVNVVVAWMLRYDRDRIAPFFTQPYLARYLKWVCHLAGEQPPSPHAASASAEFLLYSDADFRAASWRAKQVIFGHDEVIDRFLSAVRDAAALRKRRGDRKEQPPLGSFLLVGDEGIGRRFLARVIAKLLFRSASVLAFECDKLSQSSLLGSRGSPGELLDAVRQQPCQLILLERIDAAPASVLQELQGLLAQGFCRDPSSGRGVSFQNVIIVMTTTKAVERLSSLATKSLNDRAWHEQAMEAVGTETPLDQALLHAVGDIVYCQKPSDHVKAQVTAQLMVKECQVHGLELIQVDPLILASEVLQIDDKSGFGRLPSAIAKLLSKPILAASQQNKKSLSLHVHLPSARHENNP
ncbi:MAG TPA: AAA family ATPase [Pirellulaceae bacterium]|jgi:hypothetical protein